MAVMGSIVTATTTPQNITLNGPGSGIVVLNMDGAGYITFRLDGTAAGSADENNYIPKSAGAFKAKRVQTWPKVISVYASASTIVAVEVF